MLITTNPLKCEILIVCPVKRPIVFPNFNINGVPLPLVSEVKLLGVKINSSLNWNSHIDHILKKARKCFFILYRARQFRFSPVTMFTLYTWFIRTSLEYAVPVWHPGITAKHSLLLERVQRRCLRIILGPRYTDYDSALRFFNTTTLEKRRIKLCYQFAKNLSKSPKHRHLLPPSFDTIHRHNTRGSRMGRMPSVVAKKSRYFNSSVPYMVRLLNGVN